MWLRTALLTFLLSLLAFAYTSAKDYEIPTIQVEVSINEDGTVQITERLTYEFDGSFSWAEYRLPRQGYTGISNIQVSEGGQSYTNKNSEAPGTFSVAHNDEAIKLTWYYEAEDEKRTFILSYTLEGALTIGPTWSQFFWNYLASSRDKSTEQLDITINLPKPVSADSLHGWTRGPQGHFELSKSTGTFTINGTSIDDNDFAKVRALFPSTVLANPKVTNPNFSLSQAQEEEQVYQQKRNERRARNAYWKQISQQVNIGAAIIAVILFTFFYRKYGKRYPTTRFSSTETIIIPDRQRPAAIGWLLNNRSVTSVHLISTVLDLARRGYFKIREEEPEEGIFEDDDPTFSVQRTDQRMQNDLLEWEKEIVAFIERRLGQDHQKLHKIFDGNDSEVSSWFSDWSQTLKQYCFDQNWIDLKSYTGAYWNVGLQLILFFGIFGVAFYAGKDALAPLSWFLAIITIVVTAILSMAIIRPTEKGEEIKHQWTNYKKGLENAKDHNLSSDKLDKHFIYALALGLKGDELENIIATNSDAIPAIAWIAFSSNTSSVAAVASSFSTLGATSAASAPGAAGGAGASASAAGGGAAASAG